MSIFNGESKYDRQIHQAFKQLISANTFRGINSTGLLYGGGFNAETYKKAVSGHDFIELNTVERLLMNYEDNAFMIGHGRAATRGLVSVKNAHPFTHGHISGVHNGTLNTYKSLVTGTDPAYAVDSEYIFRGIEQSGEEDIIPRINGAFNLLWYDSSSDCVHMIRNEDRPYYFAKLRGREILFGASEMAMLQWILTRNDLIIEDVIVPEVMTEYVFDLSGDFMTPAEIKHEQFKAPVVKTINNYTNSGHNPVTEMNVQRIPRTIEFFAEHWEAYSCPSSLMGKWECRTPQNELVIVYQCKEDALTQAKWYIGMTRTMRTSLGQYSVDLNTVKISADDGPNVAVVEEMYKCVSCRSYYPENELMFSDSAPLCVDCINHYELKLDKDEETKQ